MGATDREIASRAMFTRIVGEAAGRYRSVGEMVCAVIRELIINGAFSPGEALSQAVLAEKIGVSRAPVRQALISLQYDGLIVIDARGGASVRAITPARFEEVYALRLLLETHALRRSIAHMTPERQDTLRSLAEELDAEPCSPEQLETRTAFYRLVYDSDANPLLIDLIERLRGYVAMYLRGQHGRPSEPSEYRALIKYMSDADLTSAEHWIKSYLDQVKQRMDELRPRNSTEALDSVKN